MGCKFFSKNPRKDIIMKRISLAMIALLLAALTLLAGCAGPAETPSDDTTPPASPADTTPAETTPAETTPAETTPAPVVDNTPVTVVDTYLPAEVSAQLKDMLETKKATFAVYSTGSAPYAIRDVYSVSNGKLKSVTVPVHTTGAADANGDLILTMSVFDNSFAGLKKKPLRTYQIKVNCAEHGLTENKAAVNKFIKIDLTSYDIVLTADETVAFYSATDTLHPAYLKEDLRHSNKALKLLKEQFPQINGFFTKMGTADLNRSLGTLVYDFEFERTYENKAAYEAVQKAETDYQAMVAALKEKYQGKKLSIMGDSISTYTGISNSVKYNSTIGSNAVWYPGNNSNFMDESYTYWGRLINDLGMELCVNNAWSGSRVYGKSDADFKDNILLRATQLDNSNGTNNNEADDINPDVIVIYMGINDLHGDSPRDINLYKALSAAGADTKAVMEEWMTKTIATADATTSIIAGKTYKNWESAYALAIRAMKEKYPNAEILCMTLVRSNHAKDVPTAPFDHYNTCIKAIANYFGATIVDQEAGYMLQENCHAYGSDLTALHPNQEGHRLMERIILESMYKKLSAQ